ncbi:5-formyltetrahydrofolate cyclo-ligase [Azospirillum oleiclasticum]|uniref:5-formyltetrahydrofolate cyclo-ligase n=1 Tax=Azospirillum oleiclasticum TaxID=2735135 RepID=UPI0031F33578
MPDIASPIDDPAAAKAALRTRMKVVRDGLADPRAAKALHDRLLGVVPLPPGPVAGYWPLGSELDVLPLLRRLHGEGRAVALPVSGPRGTPLVFRSWEPDCQMAKGRYGIAECGEDRPVVVPAVLLVPMLAFDRAGHRLGYGAGYYDRTLAELRARGPVLAVGVAYAGQEVEAVPRGGYDEPLDWIVTEREALRLA